MPRYGIQHKLENEHIRKAKLEIYRNHLGIKNTLKIRDMDDSKEYEIIKVDLAGNSVKLTSSIDRVYDIEREIDTNILDKEKYSTDSDRLDLVHMLYSDALTHYSAVKKELQKDWTNIKGYFDALGYADMFSDIGKRLDEIKQLEDSKTPRINQIENEKKALIEQIDTNLKNLENEHNKKIEKLNIDMELEIKRIQDRKNEDPEIEEYEEELVLANFVTDIIKLQSAGTKITEEHWKKYETEFNKLKEIRDAKKKSNNITPSKNAKGDGIHE